MRASAPSAISVAQVSAFQPRSTADMLCWNCAPTARALLRQDAEGGRALLGRHVQRRRRNAAIQLEHLDGPSWNRSDGGVHVGDRPGPRAGRDGPGIRPEPSPASGQEEEQRDTPHGKTRIDVAPELVETCRPGGFTIRSSSRRCTASSGSPLPPRITLLALVFGSQNTRPLLGPATTMRPSGSASMLRTLVSAMPMSAV